VKQLPLQRSQLDQLIERMEAVQPDPPSFGSPVGCSRATESKHSVYLGVVSWFVTMHSPSVRKGRQFLMGETHAGPAWYLNSTTGELTVGSPLIDLDVLDTHKLFTDEGYQYKAVFCERGKPRSIVQQLRYAIKAGGFGKEGHVEVLEGPFEDQLPRYLESLQARLCGVLFVDANGSMSHEMVQLFQSYARELHYVDICIWHQAHVRRRFNGLHPSAIAPGGAWHGAYQKYDYRPLRELLPDLGKRRWLIRKPFNAGNGTAWTMLVGSNWDKLPEWKAGEMYRLDSPMGQAILAECDG
jgi:hypothetical protein